MLLVGSMLYEAIETADEAIAVYDSADRLAGFNRRYREWRSAIGGDVRLGVPWSDLVKESIRCGTITEARGRESEWLEQRCKVRGAYSMVRKLADGRAFKVSERRMASGGIVVTWSEITELLKAQEAHKKESLGDEEGLGKLVDVARDLNSALTAVVENLELLTDSLAVANKRSSRFLEDAWVAARRGMTVARRISESRPREAQTTLTTTELHEAAADFRRQAEAARRLAKSFKEAQDLERLFTYVEELEREAILLETLAENRSDSPQ